MAQAALTARRLVTGTAAALAVGFLILMVATGALPRSKQKVEHRAEGVMELAPERISMVALRAGPRQVLLQRTPAGGWAIDGGDELDAAVGERLTLALRFMHTSNPVRVLEPGELNQEALRDFGLVSPRLSVALLEGARPVLAAHFGVPNPDGFLQYVLVDGREQVFLLSCFVGDEWDAVAQGVSK